MAKYINDFEHNNECACKQCGNKHELYGGHGYTMRSVEGYSDGKINGGYYRAEYICNDCNTLHVVQN